MRFLCYGWYVVSFICWVVCCEVLCDGRYVVRVLCDGWYVVKFYVKVGMW